MTSRYAVLLATSGLLAVAALAPAQARLTNAVPMADGGLLADLLDAPTTGDALEDAMLRAKAATEAQARLLGIAWSTTLLEHHASPGAAALALLALDGRTLTPTMEVELAAMDRLPEPVSTALTGVLDAFIGVKLATARAFAGLDEELLAQVEAERDATRFGSLADAFGALGIDLEPVLPARSALIDAGFALSRALAASDVELVTTTLDATMLVQFGTVCTDDTYTADAALIIDECGNDVYLNNAGGGAGGAAALFDYAGDDRYDGAVEFGGANGGGHAGVGFLYDEAGNDVYIAMDDGTNGGGFAGSGFLQDVAGNDVYDTGNWGWGVNGGGYIAGLGTLLDEAGDDFYRGSSDAVNGGCEFGIGMLRDGGGDDTYIATGGGVNGGCWAGHGLLLDEGGHDLYDDHEFMFPGAGEDVTVVPKGPLGAQIDAS